MKILPQRLRTTFFQIFSQPKLLLDSRPARSLSTFIEQVTSKFFHLSKYSNFWLHFSHILINFVLFSHNFVVKPISFSRYYLLLFSYSFLQRISKSSLHNSCEFYRILFLSWSYMVPEWTVRTSNSACNLIISETQFCSHQNGYTVFPQAEFCQRILFGCLSENSCELLNSMSMF